LVWASVQAAQPLIWLGADLHQRLRRGRKGRLGHDLARALMYFAKFAESALRLRSRRAFMVISLPLPAVSPR